MNTFNNNIVNTNYKNTTYIIIKNIIYILPNITTTNLIILLKTRNWK